jgi:hypothetical protein
MVVGQFGFASFLGCAQFSTDPTTQIMLDFYDAVFKTGNAPQALADTQRDWLVRLRKEHGLLAAVRLAGPFILSSQGR